MLDRKFAMPLSSMDQAQPMLNEDDDPCTTPKMKTERQYEVGRQTLVVLVSVLAFCVLLALFTFSMKGNRSTAWESCGDSPESARSRNCSFDLISFAWQTTECYDIALVNEFSTWSNWTYYADDGLTIPVTTTEALMGERDLYVDLAYHTVHCTFMWRQMHRAYVSGWIDEHLSNYNHTLHCQDILLWNKTSVARYVTHARVIYPVCCRVLSRS